MYVLSLMYANCCCRISDVAVRPSQKYPIIDYDYRSSVVDGLYFTGTIAHSLDFRQSAGGFIHGFRYSGNRIINMKDQCFNAFKGVVFKKQ